MERTDDLTQPHILAREIAFYEDNHTVSPKKEEKIRKRALTLISGIDPDKINRESSEYRYGVYDAILAVINALCEQRMPPASIALLKKSGYAHIMLAADEEPGQSIAMLTEHTGLSKVEIKNAVPELVYDGLLEPMPIKGGKRFYRPTPRGKKAAAWIRYQPAAFGVELRTVPALNSDHPPRKKQGKK